MRWPLQPRSTRSRWDDDDDVIEPPAPLVQPPPVNPDFYDPGWSDWDDDDRTWGRRGFIALVVVAVLVLGFLALKPTIRRALHSGTTTTTVPKVSTKPEIFAISSGPGQTASTTFTGDKAVTTPAFAAPGGLAVLTYHCECHGAFAVTVNDSTGTAAAIPVNLAIPGTLDGVAPMSLPAGNYTTEVTGDGKWKVTISFPAKNPVLSVPFVMALIGPEVVGPFSGAQPLSVTYGAYYAPNQIVSIRTMGQDGKLGPVVLTTPAQGGTTVVVPAQATPYYLVATGAPAVWFLRVQPQG